MSLVVPDTRTELLLSKHYSGIFDYRDISMEAISYLEHAHGRDP